MVHQDSDVDCLAVLLLQIISDQLCSLPLQPEPGIHCTMANSPNDKVDPTGVTVWTVEEQNTQTNEDYPKCSCFWKSNEMGASTRSTTLF